jgi:hypothetical protein
MFAKKPVKLPSPNSHAFLIASTHPSVTLFLLVPYHQTAADPDLPDTPSRSKPTSRNAKTSHLLFQHEMMMILLHEKRRRSQQRFAMIE